MRILLIAVTGALLSGPASAQFSLATEPDRPKTDQEVLRTEERERGYNSAIGSIPAQKATDPWGNVRDAAPAAGKPKPARSTRNPK